MKKLISLAVASIILLGCSTNFSKSPEPFTSNVSSVSELPTQLRVKPIVKAPKGMPEGIFEDTVSNGRSIKTVVKNGIFDEYVDIYYPNGKLHSHTILKNGLAEGWSDGYTEQGKLQSRILYQKGEVIKMQVYDINGKLIKEIN